MVRRFLSQEAYYSEKSSDSFKRKLNQLYLDCTPIIKQIETLAPGLCELLTKHGHHGTHLCFLPYSIYTDLKKNPTKETDEFAKEYLADLVSETSGDTLFEIVKNSSVPVEEKWHLMWLVEEREILSAEMEILFDKLVPTLKESLNDFDEEFNETYHDWNEMIEAGNIAEFVEDQLGLTYLREQDYYISILSNNTFYHIDGVGIVGAIFTKKFFDSNVMNVENACRTLKNMGDPSKFSILKELVGGQMYGKELATALNLSPATISYHIQDLINDGIIQVIASDTNRIYYELRKEKIYEVFKYVESALDLKNER